MRIATQLLTAIQLWIDRRVLTRQQMPKASNTGVAFVHVSSMNSARPQRPVDYPIPLSTFLITAQLFFKKSCDWLRAVHFHATFRDFDGRRHLKWPKCFELCPVSNETSFQTNSDLGQLFKRLLIITPVST